MFFNGSNDLGASEYKTWSNTRRKEEIGRLVEGYRAGLPIGILCAMSEAIAGSRKRARKYLHEMLTAEERHRAVAAESGGMETLVREYFL